MQIWHLSLTRALCHLSKDSDTSFREWQAMPDGPLGFCSTKDSREKNGRLKKSMRRFRETGEQYFERSWERRKETAEQYFSSPPQLWNLTSGSMWARLMPGCQATVALPHRLEMLFLECHTTLQTFRLTPSSLLFSPSFPSSSHSLSYSLSLSLSVFLFLLSANINPQSRSSFTADGQKLIVKALHGVIYQRPLQFTVCGEAGRGLGALRNPA